MSDTTNATPAANSAATTDAEVTTALYATRAECEANKPADATKHHKPYQISKASTVLGWLLARSYDNALACAARIDGYSASLGNSKPIAKETLAAALAGMTDADRAELLKAYMPPTPTTTTTGRGKK